MRCAIILIWSHWALYASVYVLHILPYLSFQELYRKVINQNNYPDSKTRRHIQDRGQDMYYWAICAVTKLGSVTLRLSRTSTHMPEKM